MIALIGWSAVGGEIAPALAQPPAKQHALTSEAAKSQVARSIAATTSLDLKRIEVRTHNTVVLVRLINTPYNTRTPSDRESLASTIAALLEKRGRQDPQLASITELHVQFLKLGGWFTRSVDTVEFRREQSGAFVRNHDHKTGEQPPPENQVGLVEKKLRPRLVSEGVIRRHRRRQSW